MSDIIKKTDLDNWTPELVLKQVELIQEVMNKAMKTGEHFGTIPGCGNKPTLLKPGAEKLALTFRLAPKYHGEDNPTVLGNGHLMYTIRCELIHINSGQFWGEGIGSCSTMEAKYRYRYIPTPDKPTKENAEIFKAQGLGKWQKIKETWYWCQRVENENIADNYNTVLKMAKKRAFVDAMLSATAASDIFTQDVEDLKQAIAEYEIIEDNNKSDKSLSNDIESLTDLLYKKNITDEVKEEFLKKLENAKPKQLEALKTSIDKLPNKEDTPELFK